MASMYFSLQHEICKNMNKHPTAYEKSIGLLKAGKEICDLHSVLMRILADWSIHCSKSPMEETNTSEHNLTQRSTVLTPTETLTKLPMASYTLKKQPTSNEIVSTVCKHW